MEIKDGTAPVEGGLVRGPAATYTPGAIVAELARQAKSEQIRALHKLHARAAWFSALVYHHHGDLGAVLEQARVEQFRPFADPTGSTAAFGFVLEGDAWLVFRGSNDVNDWARNVSYLPTWHFGFRRCFADIAADMQDWIGSVADQGHRFCVAGHSLGGALATLAAEHLAQAGRPVAMLCTFGGPRVFSSGRAGKFDRTSANLPDRPAASLGEVTFRYVDKYELVSHVPPFFSGFQHVGQERACKPPLLPDATPAGPNEDEGRLSDASEAFEEAMKSPGAGLYLLTLAAAVVGAFRVAVAKKAHQRTRYARNIDPEGAYRIAFDGLESPARKGRWRWSSVLVLLVFGLPRVVLFLLAVALFGWLAFKIFASAVLGTLAVILALAGVAFVGRYLELRKQRALRLPSKPTKFEQILRDAGKSPFRRV